MTQVLRHQHLAAITQLIGEIFTGRTPADRLLDNHFRAHRNMGARDRKFVAEAVYGCLRLRRTLEAWGGVEEGQPLIERCQRILVAYLVKEAGWSARAVEAARAIPDAYAWVEAMRSRDDAKWPLAVKLNLPDWLAESLLAQFDEAEMADLARALNRAAPVDLRINTHKSLRAEVREALRAEGIDTELTPYSPVGLRCAQRGALFNTRAFRDGLFEMQDEGSQLLSYVVEPKRRQRVVDYCAGGGGKSLHLAALMDNTGEVVALDVHERRLSQLKPRYVRAGLDNIRTALLTPDDAESLRTRWGQADRVLVDAPCSGTGTLRRNPDIKWRDIDITRLAETQSGILDEAARWVKPGGRLVYSTCSLLTEENENVIAAFLERNSRFTMIDVQAILHRQGIDIPRNAVSNGALRLLPHRHFMDGFFCVAMECDTSV